VLFFWWVSCLVSWRMRQKLTSKQLYQSNKLHGITSYNTLTLTLLSLFYSILWTERLSVAELKNYASISICEISLCPEVRCNQIQPIYKFVKSVYFAFSRGEPTCSTRDSDLRLPGCDKEVLRDFIIHGPWSCQEDVDIWKYLDLQKYREVYTHC
jgi:hypothetical protein